MVMRWSRYVKATADDAFRDLWGELASEPTVVILGGGFDPRVPKALSLLADVATAPLHIVRLDIDGGEEADPEMLELANANRSAIDTIVKSAAATIVEQDFPDVHARRSAGITMSRAFHEAGHLDDVNQVVIDISGLPRSVYFPFVRGLLLAADDDWAGNVHVVASDSSDIDAAIIEEGAEDPRALGGFAGQTRDIEWAATVWVPVLGEGMAQQLGALLEAIGPDEVVPVLPFPARNPRRGDDLLLEHRELLLDRLLVEPRNYLYAAESNPFDLYRAITDLRDRYQESLRPLGAARFVLSTHSSKLLSIGVLLAAHEMGLEVMHVSPSRYGVRQDVNLTALAERCTPTDLWLAGDAYR
jgi:hypothetical protein